MNLRLSVHNLSAAGTVVYSETRVIRTNLGGLFSVQVGSAGTTSASGTIGGVSWLSGDKYLQVEIDPVSNNNYLNMGTVQLVSVPYAFNAVTAANALTVTTNANLTGAVTSNGNLTSLAASPALTGVPTAPTAAPGTNTTQIATTEFVKAAALTGPTGAKGVQGLAGADGAAGAPGPQGIPGLDGAIGAQGIQGLPGAAGAQGIQGIQGLTGSVADVAAISATSTANGASITSGVLSLAPADATNGGIVTTGDQIFAGAKTFNADLIVNGLSVGTGAGNNNTNTAIGKDALKTNTTGRSNTANGEYSLYYNTTGNYNTANGGYSLFNNTTGEYNTANGVQALFANTEGSSNTANGKDALKANTTGSYNTANGLYALYFNKEGSFNTANGLQALFANKTGSFNTANGINAGYTNTTGDNNTFIGHGADVASAALTNASAIGAGAIVSASNTIQLGNVYVTDVKTSGTITAGVVTYPNAHGTNGQVLTTTGSGTLTWTTVPVITNGTTTGDMLYWNGSAWVKVSAGTNGQTLSFYNGAPVWTSANTVVSVGGKVWMDRNLGASQVATSLTDHLAYGSLYQWGRGSDGHQLINWTDATTGVAANTFTSTLSTTDVPGNALFITNNSYSISWRATQNDNLWQGVNGVNNPCPAGYRLPTETEWNAERLSWSSNNSAGAFASVLKLPMAGSRNGLNQFANLRRTGVEANYWGSTVNSISACSMYINSGWVYMPSFDSRQNGASVRCIKD